MNHTEDWPGTCVMREALDIAARGDFGVVFLEEGVQRLEVLIGHGDMMCYCIACIVVGFEGRWKSEVGYRGIRPFTTMTEGGHGGVNKVVP